MFTSTEVKNENATQEQNNIAHSARDGKANHNRRKKLFRAKQKYDGSILSFTPGEYFPGKGVMIVCHIGRWWLTAGKAGLLMNFPPSSEVLAVFCKTSRIGGLWRFSWKFGRALTATLSPKNLVCIPISPAPLPLLLPGKRGRGKMIVYSDDIL